MKICEYSSCTACGACVNVCGKKAISLIEDSEGFLYPSINESSCVNCGVCKKVCPINNHLSRSAAEFYMAWNKDDDILQRSSSGGVFSALAAYVLTRKGVVFGAIKNPDTQEVYHTMVDNIQGIDPLRLSKYYQSDTRKTYQQVRELLIQNKFVLFTGTACQIAGLYSALNHWKIDSELILGTTKRRLITMDVLCHGCTSKKLVDNYIKTKEKKYNKKIENYHFRVKTRDTGWHSGGGTRMKIEFADGTNTVEDNVKDTFFVGFNNYLFLRESCYQCQFCGIDRISDFTLADFWGINPGKVNAKQMQLGVSVMCVNTAIAMKMIPELSAYIYIEAIDKNEVIPYNLAFTRPGNRPQIRDSIFTQITNSNFDFAIKRVCWKHYLKADIKQCIIKCIGESKFREIMFIVKKILKGRNSL